MRHDRVLVAHSYDAAVVELDNRKADGPLDALGLVIEARRIAANIAKLPERKR